MFCLPTASDYQDACGERTDLELEKWSQKWLKNLAVRSIKKSYIHWTRIKFSELILVPYRNDNIKRVELKDSYSYNLKTGAIPT